MQTAGQFLEVLFFVVLKGKYHRKETGRKRMPGMKYRKWIKGAGYVELFNFQNLGLNPPALSRSASA